MAAAESYPDDLKYHPEHDWARIDGDEAVLGITWFAADSLGELVHFEPPETGGTVTQGRVVRRGRVGEGGLGPDLAALGRGARGQPAGRRRARDRERGSVRRGLADPDPALRPVRGRTRCSTSRPTSRFWPTSERRPAGAQQASGGAGLGGARSGASDAPVPRAHRRRPGGDAPRRSASRRSRSCSATSRPGVRFQGDSRSSRRSRSTSSPPTWPRSRRATSTPRASCPFSARASTTTTCRRSSTPCSSAASS